MTIETKYKCYDKIFFLSNKKVVDSVIRGIKIEVNSCPEEIATEITYLCNSDQKEERVFIKVPENEGFPTKEELLKSL